MLLKSPFDTYTDDIWFCDSEIGKFITGHQKKDVLMPVRAYDKRDGVLLCNFYILQTAGSSKNLHRK